MDLKNGYKKIYEKQEGTEKAFWASKNKTCNFEEDDLLGSIPTNSKLIYEHKGNLYRSISNMPNYDASGNPTDVRLAFFDTVLDNTSEWTITFDITGMNCTMPEDFPDKFSIKYGDNYKKISGKNYPVPEKAGYIFKGWYYALYNFILDEGTWNTGYFAVTQDVRLTPIFELEIKTYKITFNTDEGALPSGVNKTLSIQKNENYYDAAGYDYPVPTKVGYIFQGWYWSPDDYILTENAWYSETYAVEQDITLVALWEECLDHQYIEKEVKAATCTESGEKLFQCELCGYVKTEITDPLGHDYEAVVTAPTCTEEGYTTYTCSVCGDTYVADETDALGHDLIDHEAQAPTCTEIGWEAYQTCSRCDYTTYEENPASGHTSGAPIIENEIEATCTESGSYDSVIYCDICGEELSRDTIVVDALGHIEGEAVIENEIPATETTDGSYESVVYCTRCGEELSRETIITEAVSHKHTGAWIADVNTGTATRTCSICGMTESKALGKYKITFDPNGGLMPANIPSETYINSNESYVEASGFEYPIPVKYGYVFNGWYWDNYTYLIDEGTWNNGSFGVTEDVVLSAHWDIDPNCTNPKNHTILFNTKGGTMPEGVPEVMGINTGENYYNATGYTYPTPTLEDHNFLGWYWKAYDYTLDAGTWNHGTFSVSSSLELEALWEKQQ